MAGIRIPTYEQQAVSVSANAPVARAEGQRFSASESEGLGNIGRGLNDLAGGLNAVDVANARILRQQEQATDQVTALANVSQSSMDLSMQIEKMKAAAPPGAPNFAGQVRQMVQDHIEQVTGGEGSQYYKDQYLRHMLPVQHSLFEHAKTFEAGAYQENRINQVSQAITSSAKTVALNPSATEMELGRVVNMLNADPENPFAIKGAAKDRAIEHARKELVSAAVGSWIIKDPVFADSILADASNEALKGNKIATNDNGVAQNIPLHLATVEELNHFRNLARTESERARTNTRQGVDIAYGNDMARFKDGVMPPQPLTPDAIRTAWGNNPAEAEQRVQTYQTAMKVGQEIGGLKMLSSHELVPLLNAKPDPASPNYAHDEALLKVRGQAAHEIVSQRADDFVAWGAKNGIAGINPINWADPASIAKEMPNRAAVGNTATSWGHGYAVLSKPEAEQFATYIGSLHAEQQAEVLGRVYQAGGPAAMLSISDQIKSKNSEAAIAGSLYAEGTTTGRSLAALYLGGKEMIKEGRAKIDKAAETGLKASIYKVLDGVYSNPADLHAHADIALGVYAKKEAESPGYGVDDAINLATGGLLNYNGTKIAKPYGWDDARFRDALTNSIVIPPGDYRAGGTKITPQALQESLPGAKLKTFGSGTYTIAVGNDVVRLANGKPFVLKVGP